MKAFVFICCWITVIGVAEAQIYSDVARIEAGKVVVSKSGVTRWQAEILARAYLDQFVSGCGATGSAEEHPKYWSVPLFLGAGGVRKGSIRVDRRTAAVSYPGFRTAYPKDFSRSATSSGKFGRAL